MIFRDDLQEQLPALNLSFIIFSCRFGMRRLYIIMTCSFTFGDLHSNSPAYFPHIPSTIYPIASLQCVQNYHISLLERLLRFIPNLKTYS